MNYLNQAVSTDLVAIENATKLSTYPVSQEGFDAFMKDLGDLFYSQDDTKKELVHATGGYKKIMAAADRHFESSIGTANFIHNAFFQLVNYKDQHKVVMDDRCYRKTVAEQWVEKYMNFKWPSQFIFAYRLVINNRDLAFALVRGEEK